MSGQRFDVAIAGAGFAGSILGRILARAGRRVLLVERHRHPRFALGESSTPLAAILLETLAERYRLGDLRALAAYGRWRRDLPALRCGLKRGFTFYRHRPGQPADRPLAEAERLLVAASPADAVADAHWLRADVDGYLVGRAVEAGVAYRERSRIGAVSSTGAGLRLVIDGDAGSEAIEAGFLVDGSGGNGVAVQCGLAERVIAADLPRTGLVYGHFSEARGSAPGGVGPPLELGAGEGPPYPPGRAAVHHLIEEGWIYDLPFDHGVTSAGLLVEGGLPAGAPGEIWWRILDRYPALARRFEACEPLFPPRAIDRVAHRLERTATGRSEPLAERWLALPSTYAFFDPMFSTGIAWSLVGVERAAQLLLGERAARGAALRRYDRLLAREADHQLALVRGAYRARRDLRLFASFSFLYFAAASFQEAGRRLTPQRRDWAWEGFLGATDPVLRDAVAEGVERLGRLDPSAATAADRRAFEDWVAGAISERNLAGLANPAKRNLYPVDLDELVASAALLGLETSAVEAALPRLRGS